jgi:hypothetical protein
MRERCQRMCGIIEKEDPLWKEAGAVNQRPIGQDV